MLELLVQSGPDQGRVLRIPALPSVIGRDPSQPVVLQGPGVWERHAEVGMTQDGRCGIRMLGDATGSRLSGHEASWTLRMGESFHLGGVRVCLALAPSRQRSQRPAEFVAWLGLACVMCLEAWLALRL